MSQPRKDIYEIFAEPVDPEEVRGFESWGLLMVLPIEKTDGSNLCDRFRSRTTTKSSRSQWILGQ